MKPYLKLYRGYANEEELIVMGHVFKPHTRQEYDFRKRSFWNARSVIRTFRVKTQANADVFLDYKGLSIHTRTLDDGYFKFCIPLREESAHGWQDYQVHIIHEGEQIRATGRYMRPFEGKLAFISDIDDTFLVSHTQSILKKLFVLLFRNVNDRKTFGNVVAHYQALERSGRADKQEQNAFFYVSSSEWNLYRFIIDFTELHTLPRAVILLRDIKTSLMDFLFTGRGDHYHKFEKIKHILEFYPRLNYTLLGDDAQDDPFVYENICKIFPLTIVAVYIRQTGTLKKERAIAAIKNIAGIGIPVCYFSDSSEAIAHSRSIGLIVE